MIRLASWIIASLVITAGIAFLVSLPGTVTVDLGGYRMQPRLGVAAFLVVGGAAAVMILWGITRRIIGAPSYFARRAAERRRNQGYDALSDGFIALQAGDAQKARMLARDAQAGLPRNVAARLLEARADLALGDMAAAREHYRGLIADRRTALAALAGLYDQARTQGRGEAALTFAQKAATLAPGTAWATAAVFDDLTRRSQWQAALAMVAEEAAVTREERDKKRRRQAVLETALARDAEGTNPLASLDHALSALRLLPDFVPAALIAARIHAHRGEGRRAMSLLRRVWRATGHPDVALLYANAVPGVSAVDRLRRVRELIDSPPQNRAGAIVLARSAVEAFDWSAARSTLAPYSSADPSQAVCLLMAEIEEGQNGDQGKAREWLGRAVHAPRDPTWTADGVVAAEWEPTSPITGRMDAFAWKVPVASVPARGTEAPPSLPVPVGIAPEA